MLKHLFYCSVVFLLGCATLPNAKYIETEHGGYSYYLGGEHKPTVIFESGLGDDMTSWSSLISQVQEVAQVFAYNRAGFRGSTSKNNARNGEVIVSELRALLARLGLEPPYVLVGHSLGGAYMELYARTYPQEVAGVVLVDPNSAKYAARCKRIGLKYCDPPTAMPKWAAWLYPPAVEGEIKGFSTTHNQINAINTFPNVPLAVLSATNINKRQTEEERLGSELYVKMHKEMAALSTQSQFIACDTCGHYIQKDEPTMVVNAIKWVLSNVK